MTLLRRWEPFENLVHIRHSMGMLFEDWPVRASDGYRGHEYRIPLDVYQTSDDLVIKAAVPGVDPDDVHISITRNSLTIEGEVKHEDEVKGKDYFARERRYGSFRRALSLPSSLDTNKAEASFENGILTLTIPKAEDAKPKEVKVKVRKA